MIAKAELKIMFCPKCGLQNAEGSKFCRGCGADLSGVLAAVDGRPSEVKLGKARLTLPEKSVALYSRGVRGVLTSLAFLAIAVIMPMFNYDVKLWWLLPLTLALVVMAGAISRFVQASGYKKLAAKQERPELGAPRTEFLQPARPFYDTDDLAATPFSVTERTTNLLRKMDEDDDLLE